MQEPHDLGRSRPLMRGLVVLLGLVLVATACRAEIEGSDGTITQIDATVQIRYAEDADRAESLDLDDAAVRGPIHVFLAYLGSDIERVVWTVDGEEISVDTEPPFDLVGGDRSGALPFDTSELLGGNHSVIARVDMGGGVSLEVDAKFTVIDGTSAENRDAPDGWADVLSVNQQSLEDGADGWRDQGNSIISTTSDDAKDGQQALLATVSDKGIWTDDTKTSRVGTSPIPVDAGTTSFEGQAFVKVGQADSQARCEIRFYAGSNILDTAPGPFADAQSDWTPVACTAQAPSGTSHVGLRVLVDEATWGEEFLVDDAHLWADTDGAPAAAPEPDEAEPPDVAPQPAPTPPATAPAPPSTTTVPAPDPAPRPSSGGFPDESTTGPSGDLADSGSVTVTQNGAVVENLRVNGTIIVNADNVTVRNVHITATGLYGINVSGRNVTIEDVEIDGRPGCSVGLAPYGEWTARRVDVEGCSDGFGMKSNQTLEDSYCHDLRRTASSHNDCMQTVGGSNSVIRGNTLSAPFHQTAAILIQTNRAPATNWLIEDNLLAGGGYSVAVRPKANGDVSNLTFRNNVFVRGSHQFGPKVIDADSVVWTGNTWDDGTPLN